ncbi:hypothetical protein ACW663_10820, partial [Corynebacterium amycolatum]
ATVSYYKTKSGRRWQVQYTKPDGSRTRKRGFSTKAEAQAWIEDQGVAQRKGTWVDPALSNIPLSELWDPWIAIKKMRHGTSTWMIRATPIHDPSENFRKGWEQTGTALRKAMDHYGAMTR